MPALATAAIEDAIRRELGAECAVRYVLAENLGDALQVWTVVDAFCADVRQRIYSKELHLIDEFPQEVLDFNVLQALGRNPREIASSARVVYSRPE